MFFDDCLELGVTVDFAAYRAGRAEGLQEYCTAETGYQAGREGRRYHDVCAGAAETAFLQGYERGREERPRYAYGPRFGIGLGIGSRRSFGSIGLGFPFYRHDRPGVPYYGSYDYCFYNPTYCRARGWDY